MLALLVVMQLVVITLKSMAARSNIVNNVYPSGYTPPFKNYRGNKGLSGLYQAIINIMPEHDIYIEPFLGQGEIFCRKKPAALNVLNDIDPVIIHSWKQLYLPEVVRIVESNYVAGSAGIDENDYGGRKRLCDILFMNYPALKVISDYNASKKRVLIYADPPYKMDSRRCSSIDIYNYEMTDNDHKIFLDYASESKHNFIISCYDNSLYQKKLKGWNKFAVKVKVHASTAMETVYYNFRSAIALHDYTYLGKNFSDRQRIKRKVNRWCKKFENLPILEQNLIYQELTKKRPH